MKQNKPADISLSQAGEKRRRAIMSAAWNLFLARGYANVSVDDVVRKAGGSKSTVYKIFGSKKGLFYAIIEDSTDEILADMTFPDTQGMTTRDAMRKIGLAFGRDILSEKYTSLFWLSVSVSRRFPDVAKRFYESGPLTVRNYLTDFLKKEVKAGRLVLDDPSHAAGIFSAMVLEYTHMEITLRYSKPPSDKKLQRLVDRAVDVFLAAYGTEEG
jgi:TetR/AcrR family transcriptional repressor of mexJK operon